MGVFSGTDARFDRLIGSYLFRHILDVPLGDDWIAFL
jgi:hypothetical protein